MSRKEEILRISAELFSKKGFSATSMRDIASALNIEAPSLYNHFPSKEDILWQVASKGAEKFINTIEAIYLQNLHTEEKLNQMITAHINVLLENQKTATVFFQEWRYLNKEQRKKYEQLRKRYELFFVKTIEKGVEENLFDNIDETFSALVILSGMNWIYRWYDDSGTMDKEAIAKHFVKIFLSGIKRSF